MAIIPIGHQPELTAGEAQQIFAKHFDGKYGVTTASYRNRDFIVKKDGMSGVGVRLKQEKDKTSFVFTPTMPSIWMQALFGGLLSYLVLRKTWKELESEVQTFIATAPEFRPATAQKAAAA